MLEHEIPLADPPRNGWPWEAGGANQLDTAFEKKKIWPKITVVTPSFNQGEFIEATLRSVLLQDYPELEYIVLDGGSSDNSVEIIRKYRRYLSYWRSTTDHGQADALATGFDIAAGEIFCWLNSDDIFLPGTLRRIARLFLRHPKTDFVYGNRLVIDNKGMVVGREVWPYLISKYHWFRGQPLAQECCFWKSDLYRKVGGIDRSKFFTMDYDLFYRMWRIGKFRKTMAYLGCIRVHDESKNAKHSQTWHQELADSKVKFGLKEPGYLRIRMMNRIDLVQLIFDELMHKVFLCPRWRELATLKNGRFSLQAYLR